MHAALIVLDNDQIQTYDLERYHTWPVGRQAPSCIPAVTLASRLASREHGWLRRIEGQWFYVDNPKNTNGTWYNGRKLSRPLSGLRQPVLLEDGDILRIDRKDFPSAQGAVMLFLEEAAAGTWQRMPLKERDTVIGGGADSQLVIRGLGLEDRQAKLTQVHGGYFLAPCGTQPVLLNGRRIHGNEPLAYGDYIRMQDCHMFFLDTEVVYTAGKA